jgi:hypothetical protein
MFLHTGQLKLIAQLSLGSPDRIEAEYNFTL